MIPADPRPGVDGQRRGLLLALAGLMALLVVADQLDLEARKVGWAPHPPKYTRGVLGKYARTVASAAHGAVTS